MGQLFQLFNVHSQPNNKSQKKNHVCSSLSTNSTVRHRTNKLFKKKKRCKTSCIETQGNQGISLAFVKILKKK